MSHTGDTLKQLRKDAGFSLRELSRKAYVHWTTIGDVERGERNLTMENARALDAALQTGGTLAALVERRREVIVEDPPIRRIAPQRYFRPKSRITYIEEAERAGREVDVDHVTTQVPASEHMAERLGVRAGDLVSQTRYVIRMNDCVVTASHSWEPWKIVGGTEIENPHKGPYADQGIVPRFDAIGLPPTEVEEVLHFRFPEGDETTLFQISTLTPLVEVHQTFFAGEIIIEAADMVFPATRYQFHFRMEIK